MKLPRNSNALNSADWAKELLSLLISSLKLPAAETGKCSIAHLISLPFLMSAYGRILPYLRLRQRARSCRSSCSKADVRRVSCGPNGRSCEQELEG